jgi:predicted proteasome-type protease
MQNHWIDILKFTLPALLVMATVYFMMKNMLNNHLHGEAMKLRADEKSRNNALKLQAYERLMLLCERIEPNNLFLRLNSGDMTVQDMQQAMLVAIQQEVSHNHTQQLYVSSNLWEIINLSKNQISEIVAQSGDKLDPTDKAYKLQQVIQIVLPQINPNPLEHAKKAIKQEIDEIIFDR